MERTRLDRRHFVRTSLAAGGAVFLADRGARLARGQATPASAGETTPELQVAVAKLPLTLDPQGDYAVIAIRFTDLVFDRLIRRDFQNGGALSPALATEWRRVDDRTVEVALRRDVAFHDSTPFTAADVKYTFDRRLAGDSTLELGTSDFFPFASVDVLDDHSVRFVADSADPLLEKRLAGFGSLIVPADYHQRVGAEAFRLAPVGTGPYRLTEFVADDHLAFEANERHFSGRPAADRVTVREIPDVATRLAALTNGEVDLATDIPPDQAAVLEDAGDLVVKGVPANMYLLFYNTNQAPTDRKEVRQALGLAIDRETLVDALWGGTATVTRGLQFPTDDYYNPDRPPTPYNPERARTLLDEAGYAGEEILYLIAAPNYYTLERETAEAIVGMWAEVGINARIEGLELAQKSEEWDLPGSRFHVTATSMLGSTGDPQSWLVADWGPAGYVQAAWWGGESAAAFNELVQQLPTLLDPARRAELVQLLLDVYEDEAPGVPLYLPDALVAMNAAVDWTPYPVLHMDLRPYNFRVE